MKLTNDSLLIVNFIKTFKKKYFYNKIKNNNLNKFFTVYSNIYNDLKKETYSNKSTISNNIYLNNIDSCNHISKKINYRTNFIKILHLLNIKYKDYLNIILNNYTDQILKEETILFINNIDKYTEHEIVEWMNNKGIILSRYLYIYILERKLPDEILKSIGEDIELYGEFTSIDIKNDIEINLPYKNSYNIKLKDINLDLIIYSENEYKIQKYLLYRIFFLHYIFNNNNIYIKLWLSNIKKNINFNKNDKYIGPKEINSGCTTFTGTLPNKVSLWRKEELGKVIIHELIHSLELESKSILDLYKYFDIKNNIKINTFECYVEILAQLLNLIISSNEMNYNNKKSKKKTKNKNKKKTKSKSKSYNLFLEYLNIERIWSYFQCAKVLNYFEYKRFEDFYDENGINKTDKYNQKSNIFSYIILRSIIYYNLLEFMNILFKYNKDNLLKDNIPDEIKIKFFINSIKKNKNKYCKIINYFINYIEKIDNKQSNTIIYNSARLSAIETDIL